MSEVAYVRSELAQPLPAPSSSVGAIAWLRANLFSSWANALLTLFGLWLIWIIVPPVLNFAIFNAVWTGTDRTACIGAEGACWAYVRAYFGQFIYGRYPIDERWRCDIVFAMAAIGLALLLIPKAPYKRETVFFMLFAFPVASFILLTGGNFDYNGFLLPISWLSPSVFKFILEYVLIAVVVTGLAGGLTMAAAGDWRIVMASFAAAFAVVALLLLICGIDFGLQPVETSVWGGLLVTLVIAVTGITASLPFGILLALGRRSKLPIVKMVSVAFIEFWRGVPLITVLFVASVMLPLFLPANTSVDRLLRALIGVALFSSAYMAEVVRGGLQAIPRGQYEGAKALGLGYWKMMGLIILPQALKLVIPGIVNNFIGLFKDTTLVLIVGLFDLLGQVQSSFTDPTWATPVTAHSGYLFAAMVFWVFCFSMSRYSQYMERRLNTGHKR